MNKLIELVRGLRPDFLQGVEGDLEEIAKPRPSRDEDRAAWRRWFDCSDRVKTRLLTIGAAEYPADKARLAGNGSLLNAGKTALQRALKKRGKKLGDQNYLDQIVLLLIARRGVTEWCVAQYRTTGETPSVEAARKVGETIAEPLIRHLHGEQAEPPEFDFRWLPGTVQGKAVIKITCDDGTKFSLNRKTFQVTCQGETFEVFHLKSGKWDAKNTEIWNRFASVFDHLMTHYPDGFRTEWE